MPNTVLIVMMPWFDSGWPIAELFDRDAQARRSSPEGQDWLYGWQSHLLGERMRKAIMWPGRQPSCDDVEGVLLLLEWRGQHDALARALIDCLDHSDPGVRAWAMDQMSSYWSEEALRVADSQDALVERLIELTRDAAPEVRDEAVIALTMFTARAAQIVPVLTSIVSGEDVNLAAMACNALRAFGDDARIATDAMLSHIARRDEASYGAIEAIMQPGDPAPEVLPALTAAAQDEQFEYRGECLIALIVLGAPSDQTLPLAEAMLEDVRPATRGIAIQALCAIGTPAEHRLMILPMLTDPEVAHVVAWRLSQQEDVVGRPELAVPVLLAILHNPRTSEDEWGTTISTVEALARHSDHAREIVPAMLELWPAAKDAHNQYSNGKVAAAAPTWSGNSMDSVLAYLPHTLIKVIASLGPVASDALPLLRAELEDETDLYLKSVLEEAISAIEGGESQPDF